MGHLRRLIAFDLDGTLVESRRDLADSANDLIAELGGQPLAIEAVAGMVGEGAGVLVRRVLDASGIGAGIGDVSGALQRFLEIHDTRLLNHTVVYDGIPEALAHARRHARVAVLTNKPIAASERILRALGLRDFFDEVVGGDGPPARKPDPAALVAMMARAGADPANTLLVGDSTIDHETARRASVRCCLVTYGFGFTAERLDGTEWVADDAAGVTRAIAAFAGATAP